MSPTSSTVRTFPAVCVLTAMLLTLVLTACTRSTSSGAAATWTPPTLPATAAGRQFDGYLHALNSGNKSELAQFVADHFTPTGPGGSSIADRIQAQARFYDSSRGLNLYQIAESTETAITVVAQLRLTEEWRRLTMYVEDADPHLVTGIRTEPIDAPVIADSGSTNDLAQLDAYLRDLTKAERFSGVVLVAKDGEPVFEGAYGKANIEGNIDNTMETQFSYASVGKMFTAVAVAQLVEQGKLAYDDPISRYMPEYPEEVARQVTIEHLLTHSSGIVDFFADMDRFRNVQSSTDPQRDYLPLFMDAPLRFTPGQRFEYSNSNYILLGAIIERVSGQRYEEYIHEHVFGPAGMAATSISGAEGSEAGRARRYTEMATDGTLVVGSRHPADSEAPAVGSAAGGGFTTAGDLLRFDHALRNRTLLSAAATDSLLKDRIAYGRPGYRYAYGFIVRNAGDDRIVGHSGGFPGVDAQFEMYEHSGYTVIVLANYELVGEPVAMKVQNMLAQP